MSDSVKPRLPSVPVKPAPLPMIPADELAAAKALVAEDEKRKAAKENWGPGLPGKKRVKVPAFPDLGMGEITINGIRFSGRELEMDYATFEQVSYLFDQRCRFEQLATKGLGARAQALSHLEAVAGSGASARVSIVG